MKIIGKTYSGSGNARILFSNFIAKSKVRIDCKKGLSDK